MNISENTIRKITITEIIITVMIIIYILLRSVFYSHKFYFFYYDNVIFAIYCIFAVQCLLKLIITIIKLKKNEGIKTKIRINNILQFIVSAFYIYCAIMMILFGKDDGGFYFIYMGIPMLIMAFGLPLFQLYYTNDIKNKFIMIVYNILTPVYSLLLNSALLGVITF